jgi:lysylphosphatidylglycerol synthetase-like protein (DUF2156 family)
MDLAAPNPSAAGSPPAPLPAGRRAGLVTPVRTAVGLIRTAPVTVVVVIAVIALGAIAGTAYSATAGSPMAAALCYGPRALTDGRFETFLTGALLAPSPSLTVLMVLLIAGCLSVLERRVGSLRAAAVLIVAHVVATVGTAALLAGAASAGWSWARSVSDTAGLGLSAGAVAALVAATAGMSPVTRSRIRWAVGGFLTIMVLRSGSLVDVEHALGFGVGLAAGPLVAPAPDPAGRRSRAGRSPRIARLRGAVALLLVLVPLASIVLAAAPGVGGIVGGGRDVMHDHRLVVGLVQLAIGVVIAKAVRRGLPGGWWAAVVFCAVPLAKAAFSAATHQAAGHTLGDLACWAAILVLLLVYRRCWPLRLPAGTFRRHLPRLAVATTVFAGLWWIVLIVAGPTLGVDAAHRLPEVLRRTVLSGGMAHGTERWTQFGVGMSGWIWACALVVLLLPALHEARPVRQRPAADVDPMPGMLQRHGGGSLGWQRTWPGLSTWTSRSGEVAIGYRPVSGVAIVLGDPVGPVDRWPAAVAEFRRFCLYAGWTVCWYAVTDAFRDGCGSGWRTLQIGEDAVLALGALEFRGKAWQDVRTARNHALRDGVVMHSVAMDEVPEALRAQILEVSRGWADEKPLPEMGFTLGTVDHARDPEMRTHIAVDGAGVVHGVTTWLPVHRDGVVVGWTLDVMRRRIGGFRPVIEFLIAETALLFQAEGYQTLSLSVAPLARCHGAAAGETALDHLLDRFSRLLEPCYGFRSLLDFKRKFHPRFSPVYLGYADELDLTEISMAIGKAYLPHLTPRQGLRVVRALLRGHRDRQRDAAPAAAAARTASPGVVAVAATPVVSDPVALAARVA